MRQKLRMPLTRPTARSQLPADMSPSSASLPTLAYVFGPDHNFDCVSGPMTQARTVSIHCLGLRVLESGLRARPGPTLDMARREGGGKASLLKVQAI